MGVLPLEFTGGETRKSLGLTGQESYSIEGLAAGVTRRQRLKVRVSDGGRTREFEVLARIDTPEEVGVHAPRRYPAVRAARTAPRLRALDAAPRLLAAQKGRAAPGPEAVIYS